jgi:hypothetical protein
MSRGIGLVVSLLLVALISGCAGGGPPPAASIGSPPSPPVALAIDCYPWGCATNAASMGDGLTFHEIDASGVEFNDANLSYVGMLDPTAQHPWDTLVVGDQLIGIDLADPHQTQRTGDRLIGNFLVLKHKTGQLYYVRIAGANILDFWVNPECKTRQLLWGYVFEYALDPNAKPFQRLCKEGEKLPREWTGQVSQRALVFTGDRYNAGAKTVIATGQAVGKWFNIACAGTAVAKMHLLRHTEAGTLVPSSPSDTCPTRVTDKRQRQAMLKMITADVCGTGRSFTRDGKPLDYMDSQGFYPFDLRSAVKAHAIEAIWTSKGARCLDTPRLYNEDPMILEKIAAECHTDLPPSCKSMLGLLGGVLGLPWDTYGYGISANRNK